MWFWEGSCIYVGFFINGMFYVEVCELKLLYINKFYFIEGWFLWYMIIEYNCVIVVFFLFVVESDVINKYDVLGFVERVWNVINFEIVYEIFFLNICFLICEF